MYAIVNINGQQFKVEKDQQIIVHRLAAEEGKSVDFKDVVLVGNGNKISVGLPMVKGASVSAKILAILFWGDSAAIKVVRGSSKVVNTH